MTITTKNLTTMKDAPESADSLSLYAHIPFCRHRCSYCDFNTYTSLSNLQDGYAQALASEIKQVAAGGRRPAHTIFFGGGTPSLMSEGQMALIMQAFHDGFDLASDAEISMEANPNTVSADYLRQMRGLGINRLSFGVQSVVSAELDILDRKHDFSTVIQAVEAARSAGFDNFNIDLIYGVPGQTLASWETSLRAVLDLDPTHISLYCLTIEPGTPMQRWLNNGTIHLPDPDLAADQYALSCSVMGEAGFDHYEISNWSKDGLHCEHNISYWRNADYLGLGAGAHGHAANYRYHIVRQPRVYIRRIAQGGGFYPLSSAVAEKSVVSREDRLVDVAITQLRLLHEGINLAEFEATFGASVSQAYGENLTNLLEWGLLEQDDVSLRLSQKGWFLSNQVFHRLI